MILLGGLELLPWFTDWVTNPEWRYKFCWYWLFGFLTPLFAVNVFNIILLGTAAGAKKVAKSNAFKK